MKNEYMFPKVGDRLYLEPKEKSKAYEADYYRLIKCGSIYSLVSEETWEIVCHYDEIADMIKYYSKNNRVFKVEP